jgi:hypothetical protein
MDAMRCEPTGIRKIVEEDAGRKERDLAPELPDAEFH